MRKNLRYVVTVGMMLSLSMTGCGKEKTKNDPKTETEQSGVESAVTATPTDDASTGNSSVTAVMPSDETDTTSGETKQKVENLTCKDYDAFQDFDQAEIPCQFENNRDQDDYDKPYEITGSFDLNQDGTDDSIKLHFDSESMEAVLTVNDTESKYSTANPLDAYIFDLDTTDAFTELAIYDGGMSADPSYQFFRYDGKTLTHLGDIGSWFEKTLRFDGYGRVMVADSFLNRLDPKVIKGYFDIENGEFQYQKFDLSEVMNQEYTVPVAVEDAYFEETDKKVDDFNPDWSEEGMEKNKLTLNAGDKLTIQDMNDLETFQVTLADGREGMIYFWIGD